MPTTHIVTLSIGVDGEEEWDRIYTAFLTSAREYGPQYSYVNVSSSLAEEEEVLEKGSETHTEETLFKVAIGLREAGLDEDAIRDAIRAMQNNGILFRERVK